MDANKIDGQNREHLRMQIYQGLQYIINVSYIIYKYQKLRLIRKEIKNVEQFCNQLKRVIHIFIIVHYF